MKRQILLGKKIGRLTVVEEPEGFKNARKERMIRCKCECGNMVELTVKTFNSGHTKSCGCYNLDSLRERMTTHGASKEPWFVNWDNMYNRTQRESYPEHFRYKDVYVDPRYLEDPWAFFNDIKGTKVDDSYTVDRIDGSKGYEPCNMRWASKVEQNNNLSTNHDEPMRHIHMTPKGRYRVQLHRHNLRADKSFDTLKEARIYRDSLI